LVWKVESSYICCKILIFYCLNMKHSCLIPIFLVASKIDIFFLYVCIKAVDNLCCMKSTFHSCCETVAFLQNNDIMKSLPCKPKGIHFKRVREIEISLFNFNKWYLWLNRSFTWHSTIEEYVKNNLQLSLQ
jgi:hypothetical protein